MDNIGISLRQARLEQNISLEEVEKNTRIRKVYLEALENENWDAIPGAVYTRGFLRTYAKYLGLDEKEYLAGLSGMIAPQFETGALPEKIELPGRPKRKSAVFLGIMAILILFASQYLYTRFLNPQAEINQPPQESNNSPGLIQENQNPKDNPIETQPSKEEVLLDSFVLNIKVLQNKCWMEIKSEGILLYEGTLRQGEEKSFTDLKQVSFRLGNAGDTVVSINENILPGLGKSGEVVYKEYAIVDNEVVEVAN